MDVIRGNMRLSFQLNLFKPVSVDVSHGLHGQKNCSNHHLYSVLVKKMFYLTLFWGMGGTQSLKAKTTDNLTDSSQISTLNTCSLVSLWKHSQRLKLNCEDPTRHDSVSRVDSVSVTRGLRSPRLCLRPVSNTFIVLIWNLTSEECFYEFNFQHPQCYFNTGEFAVA